MNLSLILEQFGSVADLLAWVIGAGGAMWLFGKLQARVLENWVYWHNLPKWIKKGAPAVIAALISLGAQFLVQFDIDAMLPEGIQYLLLTAINYYMSQLEYESIKDSTYGESTREEANLLLG